MFNVIKKTVFLYKFEVFLIIMNLFLLKSLFSTNTLYYLTFKKTIIILLFIIVEIIFCFFINNFKSLPIEKTFLVVGFVLGIMYMVLIPVGLVPDESAHFTRAYEVSQGHLMSDTIGNGVGGRDLPIEVRNNIAHDPFIKYGDYFYHLTTQNSGETEFITFPGAALYAFVCYIPQAFGIMIGNLLNVSTLMLAYFGRLTNFLTWLTIMFFGLKFIPFGKKTFTLFALMPITLQQASSLSADALTISSAFALVSFVLHMRYVKEDKITNKELSIMSFLTIVLSLCKIVYLPMCLTLFLIPKERFKTNQNRLMIILIQAIIVIIINGGWLAIASRYLLDVEFRQGIHASEQILFILSNPIQYIFTIFNTINFSLDVYINNLFSSHLELYTVSVSKFYVFTNFLLFVICLLFDNNDEKYKINKNYQALIIFIITSTILLIFTSLYLQWNVVGSSIVDGVQGRYLTPVLILFPILINTKNKISHNKYYKYLILFLIFQNTHALLSVFFNHI